MVRRGPTGRLLELRHASRGSDDVMDEVGRTLLNVCAVVPGGVVVFVPSFGFAGQLVARWEGTGLWGRIAARWVARRRVCVWLADLIAVLGRELAAVTLKVSSHAWCGACMCLRMCICRKAVFVEPRGAGEVEGVLRDYAAAVAGCKGPAAGGTEAVGGCGPKQTGALLLAVVGAKLSEGINFGDDLGRCVVVVGESWGGCHGAALHGMHGAGWGCVPDC